jgi:membrane fusion protein, multidrug efflux system
MQIRIMKYTLSIVAMFILAACGNSAKDGNATLNDKKAELEKLKAQSKKLEDEIAKLDTAAAKADKPKLVALATIAPETFTHFIDLQGKVESENISYVAPRNGGGVVRAVYVKKGDVVRKGQLLLQLDDAVLRQNVVAQEQALESVKTQLTLAEDVYRRRKNLWDQGIGAEIDVVREKSNVDNLQSTLKSQQESLKAVKEQLSYSAVRSDVDGVAEDVNVRVGEMFMGVVQGSGAQIKIVNNSHLKATAQIPENYLGKVKVGNPVKISFPDLNKTMDAKVNVAGRSIDPINRSFFIESRLPSDKDLRPNQIVVVRIQDYAINNTITIPVNTLQNDDKGKFVMIAVKENNKLIARKRSVVAGEFYNDKMEIKSGLKEGDIIVVDGYQSLYDGQLLTTDTKL